MTIFELVTAKELAAYWNELTQNKPPFLGETLFPNDKKLGLDLKWIKGAQGLPTELKLSSFDAKSMPRDRIGMEIVQTKMPFFKESVYIDEELRQELLKVIENANPAFRDSVLRQIFKDEQRLVESASVSRERMRMQLISTGVINVENNGQAYTYDYGVSNDQKKTLSSTAMWSDLANSNPIEDLNEWIDDVEQRTGVKPTRAIMTKKTFNYILNNEKLAKAIFITNNGVGVVTEAMVRNTISLMTGLTIAIYNKQFKKVDGTAVKFFPDDVVTLLPEGDLGTTWFGTSPEEADLMNSPELANVAIVETGVAITTTKETDPVNVNTKVSQISLPSFEQADKILIATVAGTPASV